ncbi:MAG: hypothetical protein NTW96_07810 [Planctomycetia bacterium]|nr:hypothetical protein [Planctomycetia bacterium]
MEEQYNRFQYKALPEIPKECRQADWAFADALKKSFSEGEQLIQRLRDDCREAFVGKPFAHLHFLRAIEGRLLSLAIVKREPLPKCLAYLRRRLDLEYSRGDVYSKAAQLVLLADYAVECGEIELAKMLLKEEGEQLRETAEICRCWLDTVTQRMDRLEES